MPMIESCLRPRKGLVCSQVQTGRRTASEEKRLRPQRGAVALVEGQVVDGDGGVDGDLLAALGEAALCETGEESGVSRAINPPVPTAAEWRNPIRNKCLAAHSTTNEQNIEFH